MHRWVYVHGQGRLDNLQGRGARLPCRVRRAAWLDDDDPRDSEYDVADPHDDARNSHDDSARGDDDDRPRCDHDDTVRSDDDARVGHHDFARSHDNDAHGDDDIHARAVRALGRTGLWRCMFFDRDCDLYGNQRRDRVRVPRLVVCSSRRRHGHEWRDGDGWTVGAAITGVARLQMRQGSVIPRICTTASSSARRGAGAASGS